MKKNLLITAVLMITLVSCKDEKAADAVDATANKPEVKENFNVEMDVVAAKNDDFTVYYSENNTTAFDGTMAIWKGVKGGNIDEKVVFDIPEEIVPTHIRFDFGLNKAQDSVIVKNVKISYYGKVLEFKGSDFFNYFIKDENFKSEVDAQNGSIKFVKTGAEWKTPYFYPRQELADAIKKITIEG